MNSQFNHEECTIALSQSELIRLLESLRSSDGIEFIRAIAERMVQELIEAEASTHIGAESNEHTPTRTTIRNGHREKVLTTLAGDLDLEIPKIRTGSFFPSLLMRSTQSRTTRPLRSTPITGASSLLRAASTPRIGTQPLAVSAAWSAPSRHRYAAAVSGPAFSCSIRKPQTGITSPTCRTPPGQ